MIRGDKRVPYRTLVEEDRVRFESKVGPVSDVDVNRGRELVRSVIKESRPPKTKPPQSTLL